MRAANSSAQLQTQLPGALLTVGGGAPPGGGGGPGTSISVQGYASSAPLLRSNIVVCSAVLHVIGDVLLVRGGHRGRAGCQSRGVGTSGPCWAPCSQRFRQAVGPPALPSKALLHPLHPQPSSPLSTVIPYSVAVEGLEPSAAAAGAAPNATASSAGPAPAAEAPAVEAVRAALAAERQRDAATLKSESLAAAAAAPAVEAAGEAGTALPANATTTTAAAFTPADCPANPLIALG